MSERSREHDQGTANQADCEPKVTGPAEPGPQPPAANQPAGSELPPDEDRTGEAPRGTGAAKPAR